MYRDLLYYEGIKIKTRHEYKLHENKLIRHSIGFLHTSAIQAWSAILIISESRELYIAVHAIVVLQVFDVTVVI